MATMFLNDSRQLSFETCPEDFKHFMTDGSNCCRYFSFKLCVNMQESPIQ